VDDLAFSAPLWCESGGTWRFVTVPDDLSDVIRFESGPPSGFGAVPVEVTVGGTTWRTSLFPSAGRGAYVLPVKAAVRRAEGLDDGEPVQVSVRLIER